MLRRRTKVQSFSGHKPSHLSKAEFYAPLYKSLRNEFLSLPKETDVVPWYMRLPIVYPPFMFRRRLLQMLLCCGSGAELKSGLIDELTQHVVVETLYLTIMIAPLFTHFDFETEAYYQTAVLALFYLSVVVIMSSVVSQVTWICAIIQITEKYSSLFYCLYY